MTIGGRPSSVEFLSGRVSRGSIVDFTFRSLKASRTENLPLPWTVSPLFGKNAAGGGNPYAPARAKRPAATALRDRGPRRRCPCRGHPHRPRPDRDSGLHPAGDEGDGAGAGVERGGRAR